VAFLPSSCFLGVVGRRQRALSKAGHTANALDGGCTYSELAVLDDELQVSTSKCIFDAREVEFG
jgi:hypothetical protein